MHDLLQQGNEAPLMDMSPVVGGTVSRRVSIASDAVLITLFAEAVSGTLDVSVYASTGGGEALLFSFPQLSAATANLLLRRSSITVSSVRVEATWSGACSFKINARGIASGTSDTKLLGQDSFRVSQKPVGISATTLIAAALTDRAGLVIKNWSNTQTVYLAESLASATLLIGYPLAPKDALAMDVAAGVTVYAIADAAGADVRIAESGG